jgi:hypothetical protein
MDWIERFFHIAPDGGSGTTELLILIGLIFVLVIYPSVSWYPKRKRREFR